MAASGRPQEESRPQVFRAEHNEVEVVVIVRDGKGQPIGGLNQSNFQIRDNGRPQTISSFAVQGVPQPEISPQPIETQLSAPPAATQRRFIALFFDDLHTEPGDFARAQESAEQFVQKSKFDEDRIAIFKASENGEVTFTNNKSELLATIEGLRAHAAKNDSAVTQCPRITNYEAKLIVNQHDPDALTAVAVRLRNCICPPPASQGCPSMDTLKGMAEGGAEQVWQFQKYPVQQVLAALDLSIRVLGTMPGRRILLLNSSGFLSSDLESDVNRVIDNALRRGVVINALNVKGLYAEAPGGNLSEQRLDGTSSVRPQNSKYEAQQSFARMEAENEALNDLADSTGGKFLKNNNDFLHDLFELANPEVSYVLAFSPHPLKHDGKFHKLKVEVKTAGKLSVYARKGYFAPIREKENKTLKASADAVTALGARNPAPTASNAPATTLPAKPPEATKATPPQTRSQEYVTALVAAPDRPQPATAPSNVPSSSVGATSSSGNAADLAAERAFLIRASLAVQHYIEAFADLTADETRVMQTFDENGFPNAQRSMQSAFVIYRLRNDPKKVLEYREVISTDGHEVKGHAAHATKLWREVAEAHSAEAEARRLRLDSERYDIGMAETGLTLFEGLPLRSVCAGDFIFHELHSELASPRPVRTFAYQQVHRCDLIAYHFHLPLQFVDSPLLHAGELTLDAETGQVVREERNVYAGVPGKKSPRVAHIVLNYGESAFGILVPRKIEVETFVPRIKINMNEGFHLYARMAETYGRFSRFEVSVSDKVSAPAN
jgi:VWFA-related protein